jgi:hypothetical protein
MLDVPTPFGPMKVWMQIDVQAGKIIHLDWDFAETLVQAYKNGIWADETTISAYIACAVRDYVLEVQVPDWKKEESK